MKRSIRILVMLLALTVCISGFAFVASANGGDAPAYNYEEVLEYYESGYFLSADFNSATHTIDTALADSNGEFGYMCDGTPKYTAKATEGVFGSTSTFYFVATPENETSFGVNADISIQKGGFGSKSTFKVMLFNDKSNYVNLFEISPQDKAVSIANKTVDATGAATYALTKNASAVPTNAYFNLEFFYDYQAGKGTLVLTFADGTKEEYAFDIGRYACSEFRIAFTKTTFDNVEFYKGSIPRKLTGNDNIIAGHIKTLVGLYTADPNSADAGKYIDVIAKVVADYGFTTDNVSDPALKAEVDECMVTALKAIGDSYAAKFIQEGAGLADVTEFAAKSAILTQLTKYNDLLKTIENNFADKIQINVDAAKLAEVREIYTAEKTWLDTAKANTLATLEALSVIPEMFFANYQDLRTFGDVYGVSPLCLTYTDDKYAVSDILAAYELAEAYMAKYTELNTKAVAFVENIPVAADTTADFATRYNALAVAEANYFEDTSYNAFMTGVTIEELIAQYNALVAEFEPIVNYAEDFISKVDEAKSTLSYSVKQVALAEALTYLETVEMQYPGVTEAIADYNAIKADVENKFAVTEEYINAVIALRDAADEDAMLAALAVALEKAVNGSDVSVNVVVGDMTVAQANVILSTIDKEVSNSGIRNTKYVAAVNAIAGIENVLDLREAILAAIAIRDLADAELAEVVAANTALDAAIASYNAKVSAANATAEECNNVAVSVVEKTTLTKTTAEIVAIIKKYFED